MNNTVFEAKKLILNNILDNMPGMENYRYDIIPYSSSQAEFVSIEIEYFNTKKECETYWTAARRRILRELELQYDVPALDTNVGNIAFSRFVPRAAGMTIYIKDQYIIQGLKEM